MPLMPDAVRDALKAFIATSLWVSEHAEIPKESKDPIVLKTGGAPCRMGVRGSSPHSATHLQ